MLMAWARRPEPKIRLALNKTKAPSGPGLIFKCSVKLFSWLASLNRRFVSKIGPRHLTKYSKVSTRLVEAKI